MGDLLGLRHIEVDLGFGAEGSRFGCGGSRFMSGRLVGLYEVGRVWVFLCIMNFMVSLSADGGCLRLLVVVLLVL